MDDAQHEDNPFEDVTVAQEWINSIENETAGIRDRELYPFLQEWAARVQPKVLVDIGSGQGICADKVQLAGSRYIGVEPSVPLVERAKQKYAAPNRDFVVGSAYKVPLPDHSADTVLSINVWFHLKNLDAAAQEIARILRPGGIFLISTGNPAARSIWESFYIDAKRETGSIDGKVIIPVNPLSRNLMFFHSLGDITAALERSGLTIGSTTVFGTTTVHKEIGLFINIEGRKP